MSIQQLDLTRTAAALATLDIAGVAMDALSADAPASEFGALFAAEEAARVALGEAFALDTADRNRAEDAAAWARHRPEDMRRLVLAFPPPAR